MRGHSSYRRLTHTGTPLTSLPAHSFLQGHTTTPCSCSAAAPPITPRPTLDSTASCRCGWCALHELQPAQARRTAALSSTPQSKPHTHSQTAAPSTCPRLQSMGVTATLLPLSATQLLPHNTNTGTVCMPTRCASRRGAARTLHCRLAPCCCSCCFCHPKHVRSRPCLPPSPTPKTHTTVRESCSHC